MTDAPAPLVRVSNSFTLTVRASYSITAPLFGPEGERAWAGEKWNPRFFYPQPAKDIEGAVFAVSNGTADAIWVNTAFDLAARHFQYVSFLPGVMVTTIDVNFTPVDASHTTVKVTYTRTALNEAANARVTALGETDRVSGPDWERAVNATLAALK